MNIATWFRLFCALVLLPAVVSAQITITGVADKGIYNNTVTLTIGTQAGFDYNATLNWKPIAVSSPITVGPDFYELRVDATNQVTSAVTSVYRRFIVMATDRGETERGLPRHVPFPVIASSPAEFVGAHLRVLVPARFPAEYEIPVVAWVVDADEHPVRANGFLSAAGQNSTLIKRGVGSGFLTGNQPPGVLNYTPSIGGIATNKTIQIEAGTVWTNVSGVLSGTTTWPAQSRIRVTGHLAVPAGSTLNIGAGAIVLLNSGVNITNNGAVVITGTVDEPVVFTPTSRSQPWGGFFMRTSSGSVNATGTIFVGSGADPNGGAGHRDEQCLFLVDGSPTISLTDAAAISLAGQFGHAYGGGSFTLTRFLLQGATTGGEYTRANFTVNDSAFIECPDDSATFVDGDNDALYFIAGVHNFTNTLFGWTKDDGIDSGGTETPSTAGRLNYQSCWFESIFHEGNSLSGYKDVHTRGTVYLDCGQGIEGGYDSPTSRVDSCFFSLNKSGLRHGDNYETFSQYTGPMTATNNIAIYNHRDLFGFNWDNSGGWTNNYAFFRASNNWVTVLDTNYPNNTLWNPATDGWRLGAFGGAGRVGVGFGIRAGQSALAQFPDGIPVGLSRFCTNEVAVDYIVDAMDGTHLAGTLVFPAGLTRRWIPLPASFTNVLRVELRNPVNADITSEPTFFMQNVAPPVAPPPTVLSPLAATWKYLDDGSDQGTAWVATNFNDSTWAQGPARLGFGADAAATTILRRYLSGSSGPQFTNYYFRRTILVTNDPADFETLQFRFQRDDGCVIYLNGQGVITNNMPAGPINYHTFAATTISGAAQTQRFWTNTLPASLLRPGTNVIAAEVHQVSTSSSDIAWECEVQGLPTLPPGRLNIFILGDAPVLYWNHPTAVLEEADLVIGPWRLAATNSPAGSDGIGNRFFRLRK